jgi:predicted RecA/RadA family phage recombinase
MDAKFIQDGIMIDYTPSGDVDAGDVVVEGNLIGIAKSDIEADEKGALAVAGVFEVVKVTGVTFSKGDLVYWNASTGATATTSDTLMGVAAKDAGSELVVEVILSPSLEAISALDTSIKADIDALEVDDIGRKAVSKAATADLTEADVLAGMILATNDSAATTLTLPDAAAGLAGVICTIIKTAGTDAVTVTDGVLTLDSADAAGDCYTVGCTGAAWYEISSTIA